MRSPTWDDWCRAWSDARRRPRGDGPRGARPASKLLTAGEHLQRAGVYYHFGKFLFVHDLPQMKAAHMKAVECRRLALPHLTPPGERVAIPYEGKALYGILRKPVGVDAAAGAGHGDAGSTPPRRRPTPTSSRSWRAASRRWCSTAPARARASTISPIRGDYEDGGHGGGRLHRDAARPRHRAHRPVGREPRRLLRAARGRLREAHQGLHGARRPLRLGSRPGTGLPELTREAFRVRSHCATADEARAPCRDPVARRASRRRITCPIFIMTGKLDRIVPWQRRRAARPRGQGPGRAPA